MKKYINQDGNNVPENNIVVVPFSDNDDSYLNIIKPLKGDIKRDWFTPHFYYCLPLTIGNQYGFAIKSVVDFDAIWNGKEAPEATTVNILNPNQYAGQNIESKFGSGIITIQNYFHFKTPPNINLMTIQPPNYFIPGCAAMTGVVETDNIRRDFTFNLKITIPNFKVSVRSGDIVGAFLPIPRGFVDDFKISSVYDLFDTDFYLNEIEESRQLGIERSTVDRQKTHLSGRRYFNGTHTDDTKYVNHQKKLN